MSAATAWRVRRGLGGGRYFHITSDVRDHIAVAEREEDSRLIAAAPDMLAALQETDIDLTVLFYNIHAALEQDPRWSGMLDIVLRWQDRNRAAIAAATGAAA